MSTNICLCRYALERFLLGIMPKVCPDYYFSKNVQLVCQVCEYAFKCLCQYFTETICKIFKQSVLINSAYYF